MEQAHVVDGKKLAQSILEDISNEIKEKNLHPGLVDIVIGNDPMSEKFADLKGKRAIENGFYFEKKSYPNSFDPKIVNSYIIEQNANVKVHGIVVQLPLPPQYDRNAILKAIHPYKDVDGLHPKNLGSTLEGTNTFISPVTLATLEIIASIKKYDMKEIPYRDRTINIPDLSGVPITILGGGLLVGKPLTAFLLNHGATVQVVNEHTEDIGKYTTLSDIVITGTNQKDVLQPEQIKDNTLIIDIGQDVEQSKFMEKDIFFSPNPGGIGPLTVAFLLYNTMLTAQHTH